MFSGGGDTCEELLKQADIAMYEAKAAGRNALRFFDPDMQATLAARAEAEAALRLAIRERRFVLHYQPQVDCDGEWIGAEALVRWAHPERGLIAPGEFIPLAEETGLILPIGRLGAGNRLRAAQAWAGDRRSRDLHLSVNVSARQFSQPDFVEQVAGTLRATGAPAERLVLELTESVVLDDVAGAAEKMNALKSLGVGFAVDDFGTGYSSLAYLTRLPLDQIKIDRSFVQQPAGQRQRRGGRPHDHHAGREPRPQPSSPKGSRPRRSGASSSATAARRSKASCSASRCRSTSSSRSSSNKPRRSLGRRAATKGSAFAIAKAGRRAALFRSPSAPQSAAAFDFGEEPQMTKTFALAALALALAGAPTLAYADSSCAAQATDKKLAGAAKDSFLKKCAKDATAACDTQAADKKLAGAAKNSFTKKCVSDATGG